MSFATSNVQKAYLGNLKVVYGDWTGAAGDAPGSIVLEGGKVYLANFEALLSNGTTYQPLVTINTSVSGSVQTVTVNNVAAVTSGQFIIFYK